MYVQGREGGQGRKWIVPLRQGGPHRGGHIQIDSLRIVGIRQRWRGSKVLVGKSPSSVQPNTYRER